jgi:hypothetical protein
MPYVVDAAHKVCGALDALMAAEKV